MGLLVVVVLLFLVLQLTLATDSNYDAHWKQFKLTYEKKYASKEEEQARRETFEGQLKDVMEHNAKHDAGLVSYVKTINHQHADKTIEELQQSMLGCVLPENNLLSQGVSVDFSQALPTKKSIDWRPTRVTAVKNQGSCGSCWAFGAVGAMEGQLITVGKSLKSLSEQQVVDCTYNRNGCNGGWHTTAWDYVKKAGGIRLSSIDPYKAKYQKNRNCSIDKRTVFIKVRSSVSVRPAGNENAVANAVRQKGPVAVLIHVKNSLFNYKSGVYDDSSCTGQVNHAVVIVGYGREKGKDYWLVKNSWGSNWGERGYVKMRRNSKNQCKIASYAAYPILRK